ncbi:hypothetical protein [Ochrovirga pacifica]|uniref:hypothetical protein n=1 Tax=Ochrovirga pacifica TaxID=1042376 RepID=UPI0002559FFD|nr:hypothetical protein [Ochrovirga pacifica]
MRQKHLFTFVFITTLFFASCKEKKNTKSDNIPKITLEKLTQSPAYSTASLELKNWDTISQEQDKNVSFNFQVKNYQLGAQTQSPNANQLANSDKGQHIHFIVNNQPYSAHYQSQFTKEMPNGVHHLVAFLSRSYHESVKNSNAVVVKKLTIGEQPKDSLNIQMQAPTLIYSRPKGTYSKTEAKDIMLDFFVLNTQLSKDGNKVKATINNKEFFITEWQPYLIKNLPIGKATIELALVDANGSVIPGPFNKVKRTITIEK